MRRNSVAGKLLVVLFLALAVVGGTYLYMSKKTDEGNHTSDGDKVKKGTIKFLNSKLDGSTITQRFKAYINGKDIDIEIDYNYSIEPLNGDGSGYSRQELVEGKLANTILFSKKTKTNSTSQRAELFETGKIDKEFTIDYFDVIRGTDGKDYIAIATHIYDFDDVSKENFLYILNDKLEVINKEFDDISRCRFVKTAMMIHPGEVGLLSNNNIWFENELKYTNLRSRFTSIKIEDDRIYLLYHNTLIDDMGGFGTIEKRVYTIDNDKLEYTVEETYKADSKYGDICKKE